MKPPTLAVLQCHHPNIPAFIAKDMSHSLEVRTSVFSRCEPAGSPAWMPRRSAGRRWAGPGAVGTRSGGARAVTLVAKGFLGLNDALRQNMFFLSFSLKETKTNRKPVSKVSGSQST